MKVGSKASVNQAITGWRPSGRRRCARAFVAHHGGVRLAGALVAQGLAEQLDDVDVPDLVGEGVSQAE